jgi:hypothetical protein
MEENNSTTPNFDDFSRIELVDLIVSANNQVTDLTDAVDNLRQGIVDRDLNVVKLKDCIRAVVDKFRSELIEENDVTISDWDDLQEWFDDFDGIADLAPPVRTFHFEVDLSTTKRFTADVTDPSLGESDILDMLINGLDTYQRIRFLPSDLGGIEGIEDDDHSTEFEIVSTSLSED